MRILAPLLAAALLAAPFHVAAEATSCLVTGERSARVMTPEGERSPVFLAGDCEALRLVSGKASASWVGRDGKPRLMPITAQGPGGVPAAGAEERPVKALWAELTTRRERQQPAYMRDIGGDRPSRVYVQAGGLLLLPASESAATLRVQQLHPAGLELVATVPIASGAEVRVPSAQLLADAIYQVDLQQADRVTTWRLRPLPAADAARLDGQLAALPPDLDEEQRLMLQAMMYEQLRLPVNVAATVQALRKLRGPD